MSGKKIQKMYRCFFISLLISCYCATLSTSLPPAFYQRKALDFLLYVSPRFDKRALYTALTMAVSAAKDRSKHTSLDNTMNCLKTELDRITLHDQQQSETVNYCLKIFENIHAEIFTLSLLRHLGFTLTQPIVISIYVYFMSTKKFTAEEIGTIFIDEAQKMLQALRSIINQPPYQF